MNIKSQSLSIIFLSFFTLNVLAQHYSFEQRLKITFFGDFSKNLYNNLFIEKKSIKAGFRDAFVGAVMSSVCYESAIEIVSKHPDKAICSQFLFEKSQQIKSLAIKKKSILSGEVLFDRILCNWQINYLFFRFNISEEPGFKINQASFFPLASYGVEQMISPCKLKPGIDEINWELSLKSGVFILGREPYNNKCLMTEAGNLVIGR